MNIVDAWEATVDRGADDFWRTLEDRRAGRLPERFAPLFFAALGRLTVGCDDQAGRAALLRVLGRAYRRHGLLPHVDTVGETLLATVARHSRPRWTPQLTDVWERAGRRAAEAVRRAAARADDGPAWWPAEVIAHDRPCDTIAILTVRPWQELPFQPGQAVPVSTPRRPGHWRWLSPANAPIPQGTVELHVRALAAGPVAHRLVHDVRPGEVLWLGPPRDVGLRLDPCENRDLLLVAGGTGLAPLRALVEQVAAAPDGRRVTLVVGARTFAGLYDATTLDRLQQAHDWLAVVPALSADADAEPAEQGDALTVALDHHRPDDDVYVCGPPPMLVGARGRLLAAGVPAERIHLPTDMVP